MKPLSFKSEEFASGGLRDRFNAEIVAAAFVLWDYNGTRDVADPALALTLKCTDPDSEFETTQHYSAGSAERLLPSDDADFLVPTAEGIGLSPKTNLAALLVSLEEAGVPDDPYMLGKASALVGCVFLFLNKVPTGREGMANGDGTMRPPRKQLLVEEIVALPTDKPKKAKKAKAKKSTKAAAAAPAAEEEADGSDPDAMAESVILGLVEAGGEDGLPAARLATPFAKHATIKGLPGKERLAMMKLAADDAWLGDEARPWTLDDGVLSL